MPKTISYVYACYCTYIGAIHNNFCSKIYTYLIEKKEFQQPQIE
jgi:hypothetical protein